MSENHLLLKLCGVAGNLLMPVDFISNSISRIYVLACMLQSKTSPNEVWRSTNSPTFRKGKLLYFLRDDSGQAPT